MKRMWLPGCVLVLYLMLSLAYFGRIGDYGRMYLGLGPDPIAYIWCLNWWPWAIAHGLNPFISYYIWYPDGFNMTWAGSVPAAAFLMFPVTWLANAVVSFNLLTLLAPALSSWIGFLLIHYLTRDRFSSFVGGCLFGFSSYELGELLGHLNLDVTFVVPLLVLLVVLRIKGDVSRLRFIASLAAALLFQLGLATEILATACLFGVITWAIFLAFAASAERQRLWAVGWEIILAGGVAAIVAAPFLFFVLQGFAEVPSQIHPSEYFSVDPLNFLIPTQMTRLGGTLDGAIVTRFDLFAHGAYDAYLGLPLILILILQCRDIRRRPYLKPLLASLLVMLVLSLGPSLRVAGVTTKFWLPWSLALHFPLINQAMPIRFSLYVSLFASLSAALWLSAARGGWERVLRFTLAALACLCLTPNPALFQWTPLPLEPFFEPQNIIASLGQAANVIILPYGETGPSLIWQWQSGMAFSQSGGYVGLTPPAELKWPVLRNFFAGTGGPSFDSDISAFCGTHEVSAILVAPGTPAPLAAAVHGLHWEETMDHGVRVVHVPHYIHYLLGDFWPEEGDDYWMGYQIKIVTRGEPMQLRISGRDRPSGLGPVEIRVVNGLDVSRYQIASQDTALVSLPANGVVSLTAAGTFVPEQLIHNGDRRHLSVRISLHQNSGSGQH